MPPKRKREHFPDNAEPQRPTPAGNMFHWSVVFPVDHWYPPLPLPGQEDNSPPPERTESDKWLESKRRKIEEADTKGFLLIKQLYPLNRSMLVWDSRRPRKLYVNKRVRKYLDKWLLARIYGDRINFHQTFEDIDRVQLYAHPIPGDIRFARIAGNDPRVEEVLPDDRHFQKLFAYGFPHPPNKASRDHGLANKVNPNGKKGIVREEIFNASLYYEYLNGGSLEHAMMRINRSQPGSTCYVEEVFIWHVMEQLLHALNFLHFGVERAHVRGEGPPSRNPDAERPTPNWRPIVHRWITMDNIMLHWPDPSDEKDYKWSMDGRLPRVVLTNFDNAARVDDEEYENGLMHFGRLSLPNDRIKEARYGVSPKDRLWQVEPPHPWQDLYAVGKVLRRMIVDRSPRPSLGPRFGEDLPERMDTGRGLVVEPETEAAADNWFDVSMYNMAPYMQSEGGPYSDKLICVIARILGHDQEGKVDWTPGEQGRRFTEEEKPPFHDFKKFETRMLDEAYTQTELLRSRKWGVEENHVSIASVRPPDDRDYLMPFRTKKVFEHAADREIEKLAKGLNGPCYKVVVDYGPETEGARLAMTNKMRALAWKMLETEEEMADKVRNLFEKQPATPAEEGLQQDERRDYEERLGIRNNEEWGPDMRGLVAKRFRKLIRPAEKERRHARRRQREADGFLGVVHREGVEPGPERRDGSPDPDPEEEEEETEEQQERRERNERNEAWRQERQRQMDAWERYQREDREAWERQQAEAQQQQLEDEQQDEDEEQDEDEQWP
ncbi:hypothetical protein B0T20DRAFT_96205 [Sordaria brevicollis]|uniref:Protein kinase domain-containing protein n=1 Tax=Sordaria brevicollis TaxID=83679 RepID=A0AAE0U2K2_SORBR|nr:hypothetical protein B0T20DRAFT_96205 [Sordaria brevicollis]